MINRRAFLGLSAGLGLGIAGCAGGGSDSGGGIRYFYFGNNELRKAREQAIALFNSKHPDAKVSPEAANGADYWDKLAPMVSSGSAPDVLAMNVPYITEYGARNALLDLTPLTSAGTIDITGINKDLLVPGRTDGRLVALPLAASTNAIAYHADLLEQTGGKLPGDNWTWDELGAFAKELTKELPKGVHGTEDMAPIYRAFEIYVLSRGEQVFGPKELAVSKQTVGDWFSFWDGLRKAGGAVPADVSSVYNWSDWPNSPLVRRKSVLQIINSNSYIGVQALVPKELGLHLAPRASAGGRPGAYLFAPSFLSLYARTKVRQQAATFLNWLLNSPEAGGILKLASGPPASATAAKALTMAELSPVEQRQLAYFTRASNGHVRAPPQNWPKAASQVQEQLRRDYQDVSFGRKSISAAVDNFFSQSNAALRT